MKDPHSILATAVGTGWLENVSLGTCNIKELTQVSSFSNVRLKLRKVSRLASLVIIARRTILKDLGECLN